LSYVFQLAGARLVAACDVHEQRLAAAVKQIQGVSGEKPREYHDYRQLLADKDIDAVIVATNEHWHVLPAIEACAAGKDVYLEKPVGTSIAEGRAAVIAARQHDRIVQMGTQQHSWEHYAQAVDLIRKGRLGRISQVHVWDVQNVSPGFGAPADEPAPAGLDWDFWLGPSPAAAYNRNRYEHFYWFFDYGGGWQVAWGAHHFDIVHWAMGVDAPIEAAATGGRFAFAPGNDNREWPDTFNGSCVYPAGPVAPNGFLLNYTCRAGCGQPIMGRTHGKAFYGSDGVLVLDRSGFEILPEICEGKKLLLEEKVTSAKKEHDVVQDHARSFLNCIRTRKQPAAHVEVGHRATNVGHLMNIAWRVGRSIRWDTRAEQIVGDSEAARMLHKHYRAPWRLPA
jgi:predicted dehydrogenase